MKVFSATDRGLVRSMNQDSIYCQENAVGSFPNLFMVADGMGGHKAGDYASRTCVERIAGAVKESTRRTPVSIMEEAVSAANKKIIEDASGNSELTGMGTTLVMAVIIENIVYVANVGDSRLYLIREGCIRQITEDHSLVEEMVRNGEIKKEEARLHPNKNIITRAIGAARQVTADYFEIEIGQGDFVLLCSDGLSNMIEDQEMLSIVKDNGEDIRAAGEMLVETANRAGGKDNISIILIKL